MTRTYTHLAIALLVCAASAAGYAFWYLHVEKTGKKVAALELSVAARSEELRNIQEARNALVTLTEREANLQGYFVPDAEVVPFLEEVGDVGRTLGSVVEVVSVTEGEREGRGTVSLSLRITGPFDAVMRTVGALEYAPYDIVLTNFSADAVERGEAGALWGAQATYEVGTRTL